MSSSRSGTKKIMFDFAPGTLIADKYIVEKKLGVGWESEVYLTRERVTGVERTAKFFFPHRNPQNQTVRSYAKKLHRLRDSGIMIQYHSTEQVLVDDQEITCMLSEFVDGELLSEYVARHRGRRLPLFKALHLLHALAAGMERIHHIGEYHGDLHWGNVLVRSVGIGFKVRLIDLYDWRDSKPQNIRLDVTNLIRIFYDCIGGQKYYRQQPDIVKEICCGLRAPHLHRKFRHAGALRRFLETMEWDSLESVG